MNCLLIEPEEFNASTGHVRLAGRRRRHAEEILRARVGDTLRVGLVGGELGKGRILELDRETLRLEVVFDEPPPPKRPFWLILALPRPPVFRRLLSTIASLGIDRLLVVGTARTEKSFWQSHVIEPAEVRERLLLGIEQARDTALPEVTFQRYFEPLVDDVLPGWTRGRRAFVAHPAAEALCPHAVGEPVTVFVGPEGGFIEHEIERLTSIGFETIGLGPRVLRVEPVIPMLVGRLG